MELAEVVGQLAVLRRFPVRSLGGETPDECLVQGSGLAGDRIYDVYDETHGSLLGLTEAPFLVRYRARFLDSMVRGNDLSAWVRVETPDGAESALTDRSWLEDVARRCGHPVSLRSRPDAETDPAPLQLVSVPTIRFLEKQYGGPLEPARLHANVVLDLPDGRPFEEDQWLGRQVWIGDVLLEIVGGSEQCVLPTLESGTTERSPGILSAIARGRGGKIGVTARALAGNRLRVGDPVALVD
jgi:MOSC domain-containing protein